MVEDRELKSPLNYRWLVFGLLALAYLLVYFHRLSPAVVAVDMMKEMAAGGALMGLLASAYFYPYALMQLPAGLLSDSWGPRKTITLSFILAGFASIVFGLAPTVGTAIIARIFVGLGVSMLFVPTMKILTHWFKRSEFAVMTALLMTVGGLGVLTAATPLAYLSSLLGWRASFIVIGAITLVLAAAIWFFVRNSPEEFGMASLEKYPGAGPGVQQSITLAQGMKMVLTRTSFWPLAIWFFFTCGIFFSFGGLWGGPYLMHVFGYTKSQTGHILSMLAVGMIVGSLALSYVSGKIFRSRKKVILVMSVLVLILTGYLAFRPTGFNTAMLYIFVFLLSLSSSAIVVIGFTSAKELFPVEIAGTSVGLVNFFPFFGGAVFQPIVGWVLEISGPAGGPYPASSYGKAFMFLFGSSVIAFLASLFIEDTFPKEGR